jgi:hypothetical protein
VWRAGQILKSVLGPTLIPCATLYTSPTLSPPQTRVFNAACPASPPAAYTGAALPPGRAGPPRRRRRPQLPRPGPPGSRTLWWRPGRLEGRKKKRRRVDDEWASVSVRTMARCASSPEARTAREPTLPQAAARHRVLQGRADGACFFLFSLQALPITPLARNPPYTSLFCPPPHISTDTGTHLVHAPARMCAPGA